MGTARHNSSWDGHRDQLHSTSNSFISTVAKSNSTYVERRSRKRNNIKRIILIATINPETINPETSNPMKIDESSMSESLKCKTLVN